MGTAAVGGSIAGGSLAALLPSGARVAIAAGFTPAGITAGSAAATAMSAEAIASGGGVVAGGPVATMQSLGATAFAGPPIVICAILGGLFFAALQAYTSSVASESTGGDQYRWNHSKW